MPLVPPLTSATRPWTENRSLICLPPQIVCFASFAAEEPENIFFPRNAVESATCLCHRGCCEQGLEPDRIRPRPAAGRRARLSSQTWGAAGHQPTLPAT